MEFAVRKMRISDIQQVQNVAKTSWNATYNGIIPIEVQERFLESAYNDEMMSRRLERSHIYVAELNKEIIGFANFSFVRNDGKVELSAIYLYPEYQGKGIGSALLKEGINESQYVKEVFINVEKENIIGRKFYEAKKFQIVKEFDDDFDGHILKTVRMVLKL
ncbi:ribosomal protein S18 acetylase RimI-like enzyme [Paenibacillus phyllosphaerae]|uniref:Ribosomal protein S18 acetylase RimI-like enzyme n=1 Tax=Paenibacillus phyllosphaerae TaxID=274593 RepID=A0A7W5AVP1_9BACL|nr:GNAT family N-acetyltransferase [Paenibacillus phyllosphaerae]MBB3109640.1 ribosomal protein S18 acetylase RimI-like enzyme [Paenibacillus phyllosphaerae]